MYGVYRKLIVPVLLLACIVSVGLLFETCKSPSGGGGGDEVFTVTFFSNGGSDVDSQIVNEGGRASEPEYPVKIDWQFDGWYTDDGSFLEAYDFNAPVNGNIDLYAKWALVTMVWVEAGSFQMGTDTGGGTNEQPAHKVTLSGFYMAKYEVTQELYEDIMGTNPSYFMIENDRLPASGEAQEKRPVEQVSWLNAVEFCNKLSVEEGLESAYTISGLDVTIDWSKNGYRLPTEAEWEYAARGGNGSPGNYAYAGSNDLDEVGWYTDNCHTDPENKDLSSRGTHEVGRKKPNGLGIYDMSGNVSEWCWDWYKTDYYAESPAENPKGPDTGTTRIFRGGSWQEPTFTTRSTFRIANTPLTGDFRFGFRVVR